MNVHHHPTIVVPSVLVAMMASYTALDLARRVADAPGGARLAWVGRAAAGLATGVWVMHFVAMLAIHLPVPITPDVPVSLWTR